MASQSRAAKWAKNCSTVRVAAFSSRRACGCSSSKRASAASRSASSKISTRLIKSPSTVRSRDHPPLGVEALSRGPIRYMGDDRSEFAQPMHRLDVDVGVWSEVPYGAEGRGQIARRDRYKRPMIDVTRSASSREVRDG